MNKKTLRQAQASVLVASPSSSDTEGRIYIGNGSAPGAIYRSNYEGSAPSGQAAIGQAGFLAAQYKASTLTFSPRNSQLHQAADGCGLLPMVRMTP
jgi:hypothetical protein